MLVDFQHHYTPPELMETGKGDGSLRLDENHNARLGRQNVVEGRRATTSRDLRSSLSPPARCRS